MNDNKSTPMITIGIVTYKNYEYIKDALNSVFEQTYPNIQLIITNDGSRDFDNDDLNRIIQENKTDNVKEILIKDRKKNIGTVRNVEDILQEAKGEFFMLLAADDALYDKNVFTTFVSEFQRRGDACQIISARAAMCTEDIDNIEYLEPSIDAITAIVDSSSKELFGRMTHTYTIPAASTCYRTKLLKSIGGYDLDYFLIEDAPLFMKLARQGVKFYWKNGFVAIRHRDGGVSHGNNKGNTRTLKKYQTDELKFYEKEVIPFRNIVSEEDYKLSMEKYNWCKYRFYCNYLREDMHVLQRISYLRRELPDVYKSKLKEHFERFANRIHVYGKEIMVFLVCVMYLINAADTFVKEHKKES